MDLMVGRVAVLTGAGSGIGRATALSLAGRGIDVVVTDLDLDRAQLVAEEVTGLGANGVSMRVDVRDQQQLAAARDLALARFGRVDIVMNNVGVIATGLPQEIPLEAWQRIIEVNLLSVVKSLHVFLPLLIEQGDGHIVNTASTAALYGYAYDRLPYAATKGAIVSLSEGLALYLKPLGIGVTLLCPGPTTTNIVEQITTYGPHPPPLRSPNLAFHSAAEVGDMVTDAIEHDRYFVPTNRTEIQQILSDRARDLDAFVASQINAMRDDPNSVSAAGDRRATEDRRARGIRVFEEVNGFPGAVIDPLTEVTVDHVFAEIWTRPGLTRKERRWISLSCAGASGSSIAMRAHVMGALSSGDITIEELREFVLHLALYQGFPKAAALRAIVEEGWSEVSGG